MPKQLVWKTAEEEEVAIQEREKEQRRHFSYILLYIFCRSIDSLCGCGGENLKEINFFPKGRVAKINFAIVWIFYALWYEFVAVYDGFFTAHLDPFPSKNFFTTHGHIFEIIGATFVDFPGKRVAKSPPDQSLSPNKKLGKSTNTPHTAVWHIFSQGKNMKGGK